MHDDPWRIAALCRLVATWVMVIGRFAEKSVEPTLILTESILAVLRGLRPLWPEGTTPAAGAQALFPADLVQAQGHGTAGRTDAVSCLHPVAEARTSFSSQSSSISSG